MTRPPSVLLRVPDAVPFERVRRAAATIRAAGVTSVRLAIAEESGEPRLSLSGIWYSGVRAIDFGD